MKKLIQSKSGDAMGHDIKYSRSIKIPQYLPSGKMPDISSLCDIEKYAELIRGINESNVSDAEKKFLRLAAARHIVFRYDKIADYYAQASKEVQELMESSALVIIDVDDAIANGYVALSARMSQLVQEEKLRRKASDSVE